MGLATAGLVVVDILQFGLDPLTDAATGGTATEGTLIEEQAISEEETAVTEAEATAAQELDELSSEIVKETELGDTTLPPSTNITPIMPSGEEPSSEFFQRDLSGGQNGSTIDEIGNEYLQEMKQEGVVIDDTSEPQAYLKSRGNRGITWNNSTPEDAGTHNVTVLLGENANNATVYEEYLHYQELKANNWVGASPGSAEYKDWTLLESLFLEEVETDFSSYGVPPQKVRREDLVQSYQHNLSREGLRTQHICSNFRITINDDTAHCISNFIGQHFIKEFEGGNEFYLRGEYHDQLTRTQTG